MTSSLLSTATVRHGRHDTTIRRTQVTQESELAELVEAARRMEPRALTTLALVHELGHGVGRDLLLATHLYFQAAERGEGRAQFCLGNLYEQGLVAEPSPSLARLWFARAAYSGHMTALRRLEALAAKSLGGR